MDETNKLKFLCTTKFIWNFANSSRSCYIAFMCLLDLVITLSLSVNISYFLPPNLSFTVPFNQVGCLILELSGFESYKMGVPTGNLLNSWPFMLLLSLFSAKDSISASLDFWWMSIMGKFVLNFLPLRILLGLLLIPGISVALNMNIASHVFSAFLFMICFIVWTILSTLPIDWWLYALDFSTVMLSFSWNSTNFLDLKHGPLAVNTLLGSPKSQ